MSHSHVVAWIDHDQAHIIHFNKEASESEVIASHASHAKAAKVHHKNGTEHVHYYNQVADALNDSREILIVGPGLEKLDLMKHLLKHRHDVADKVLSVETVDHPSDGQLLAYARKYFVRADKML